MPVLTPTLIQQTATASTTAAPVSFTANYGSNTTAGTTLFALVATANSAGGPTIAPPTNWPAATIGQLDQTNISLKVFYFNNNPGGFTAVAFPTFTNINAVGVALFEFSGFNPNASQTQALDPATSTKAATEKSSTSATAISITTSSVMGNGLWLGLLACDALQTLTPANAPATGIGAWQTGSSATSTTGASNIKISSFFALPGPAFPSGGVMTTGLTIGVASYVGVIQMDFLSLASSALANYESGVPGGVSTWTGAGAGQSVGV